MSGVLSFIRLRRRQTTRRAWQSGWWPCEEQRTRKMLYPMWFRGSELWYLATINVFRINLNTYFLRKKKNLQLHIFFERRVISLMDHDSKTKLNPFWNNNFIKLATVSKRQAPPIHARPRLDASLGLAWIGGACLSETVARLIKLLLQNEFCLFSNCVPT